MIFEFVSWRGSLRNAIPRESAGIFVVPTVDFSNLQMNFEKQRTAIIGEFSLVETNASIQLSQMSERPSKMVVLADQKKIVASIYALPNMV